MRSKNWVTISIGWFDACSAPSHYLNQSRLSVNWTLRNKFQWNFNQNLNIFNNENSFKNDVCKMVGILYRPKWVIHEEPLWVLSAKHSGCSYLHLTKQFQQDIAKLQLMNNQLQNRTKVSIGFKLDESTARQHLKSPWGAFQKHLWALTSKRS